MAKEKMVCPFSNRLCEECALYRGRHYYLCFCRKYRGYLGTAREASKQDLLAVQRARPNGRFEIPPSIPTRAIDPFVIDLEDYRRKED